MEKLPKDFSKNTNKKNDDDYNYSKVSFEPNVALGSTTAIEHYWTAYAFKNGFMLVYDRGSMYD